MYDSADRRGKIEAKEVKKMASSNWKLTNLKNSSASEAGVTLKQGYNGDLSSKDAGRIGGVMVKKMIQYAANNMPESQGTPTGRF
jgi:Small, acid-soluble spore proteins, alpha/beta type.